MPSVVKNPARREYKIAFLVTIAKSGPGNMADSKTISPTDKNWVNILNSPFEIQHHRPTSNTHAANSAVGYHSYLADAINRYTNLLPFSPQLCKNWLSSLNELPIKILVMIKPKITNLFKNDFIPLLTLAIPIILTGVVQSSLNFFENIFLSRLGENVLAAGGLVGWLFATLVVIVFGLFSAVNVLIAHKHGANDKTGINLVLRDGLLLAILFTLPTFILFWKASAILSLLGQSAELAELAKLYLHALAWGLLPKLILIVLYEFLMGLGHARTIMLITLLTIPIYIFFSYVLIFGRFGFPALGIAGAGWGMTFADWIFCTAFGLFLYCNRNYQSYITGIFQVKKPSYLAEIIQIGAPIGLMYSIEVAFFLALTLIMGTMGIQPLAANQLTIQYLGPLIGVIFSIAQAVTVRMGHQIGAQQFNLLKKTALAGVIISTVFMLMVALAYWLVPNVLISVDFDIHQASTHNVISFAQDFLFIAAFFQILESIRITLFGALRALKDTRFTLYASMISFWGISLPSGYIFAKYLNWGPQGLWWGMVMGAMCGVLLLILRIRMLPGLGK